jgi:hypothetical protein
MPNLFPTFEMPELVEDQQTEPEPEYGTSWLFDFDKGDFVVDGAKRIVQAYCGTGCSFLFRIWQPSKPDKNQ